MALTRRTGQRFQASIWPGFVDAMTALLLVLMFVLSIFMIVQFMLRETITGQESQLKDLNVELQSLAEALGLERQRGAALQAEIGRLDATLDDARAQAETQDALIASLNAQLAQASGELENAQGRITAFESQVAALLLRQATLEGDLAAAQDALSAEETARLNEAAAAQALRARLAGAEDELTAMTLALEAQRQKAEDTLTLLAAAQAAQADLDARLSARVAEDAKVQEQLSEAERQAALLAVANRTLSEQEARSAEDQRKLALLNQQVAALRTQLAGLQGLLDAAEARDADAQVQLQSLGTRLNTALAQVADEQRRRAELEAAERARLEEEARDLANYRSEFFGRMREVLAGREGVRVVGDRFVFSSEVLFATASADLAPEGRAQIANVAAILREIADEIPAGIDWIIRVDGHTDSTPLTGTGRYRDNWELSQARALSVVRYMTEDLGFPSERLAANGFGEFQPVNPGRSPAALAQNRRIELKLTER